MNAIVWSNYERKGECPVELKAAIMREKDIKVLRAWNKMAAKAESIAEFEEKSGVPERV